jgi:hypothetical protein
MTLARFALGALLVSIACAPPPSLTHRSVVGGEADLLPRDQLEYGDQCAEARRSANDSTPPAGYRPPRALEIPLLIPTPYALKGKTVVVSMRVDSIGRQVPSTLTITGLPQHEYANRLRSAFRGVRFYPARIGKCAVSGIAEIRYDL